MKSLKNKFVKASEYLGGCQIFDYMLNKLTMSIIHSWRLVTIKLKNY